MKLFRFAGGGGPRLGIEDERGARHDLTAASPEAFASVASWLALPDPLGAVRDARAHATAHPLPPDVPLLAPIDGQEVWAAGVTYERSRAARKEESAGGGDFYDRVYDAERPELFFKATPRLVAGPGAPVRIR